MKGARHFLTKMRQHWWLLDFKEKAYVIFFLLFSLLAGAVSLFIVSVLIALLTQ